MRSVVRFQARGSAGRRAHLSRFGAISSYPRPLMPLAVSWKSNVHKPVILVIGLILVGYALATLAGWTTLAPQAVDHDERAGREVAHFWAVIPFILLLGAIAVLPLLERTAHWWEHN